jgi:O-methyltransferase involved in polyketide biosynthesis
MKHTYEKISPTAKLVAYLRTFSDIPFSKEIATESEAEKTYQDMAGESKESLVRFSPYWEARYKATDEIIKQRGMTQILELAAGLSPRGLVMTEKPDVVYVSTDLPQILEEEKAITEAILSKLNVQRRNLHFEMANALDRDSLLKAASIFKTNLPVAIVTEGLFPYFSREEQTVLANNICNVLTTYHGIWVVTDVHTKPLLEAAARLDKTVQKRRDRIASDTGSSLGRSFFSDENDLRVFFETAGFQVEEYPYSNVIQCLSSTKTLNLSYEDIKPAFELLALSKAIVLTRREPPRD